MQVTGSKISEKEKELFIYLMDKYNMKEIGFPIKNVVKVHLTGLNSMKNIQEVGSVIKDMVLELIIMIMVTNMLENGIRILNMAKELTIQQMGKFYMKVNTFKMNGMEMEF